MRQLQNGATEGCQGIQYDLICNRSTDTKDLAEKSNKIKFSSLRKMNEVAGTDPDAISGSSMGVGGTLGGSMNKMPMQTLASDNLRSGPNNKKKKLGDFKK